MFFTFLVLPGFPRVAPSRIRRIEVQSALEEVDDGLEMLPVPVAAGLSFDGHGLAMYALTGWPNPESRSGWKIEIEKRPRAHPPGPGRFASSGFCKSAAGATPF